MNIEIEAKMRVLDVASLEACLRSAGAEPVARLTETNTYFDTAEGDLKSSDRGLRIRVEKPADGPSRTIITHKGPRAHGQLKSRTETEVIVEDPAAAANLLIALGYMPTLTFEKRRQRWKLDGCHVELDTLPHLGQFVEIEGPSDEAVLAVREKLGLTDTPLLHASYIAMLVTHMREHHLGGNQVLFENE